MKWKPGLPPTAVVSDELAPDALKGSDAIDYYGGFLVAESVPPSLVPLIAAAPEMADAAGLCLKQNGGPIDAEDTDDGQAYVMVRRVDFDALEAAWRKATGAEPPRVRE